MCCFENDWPGRRLRKLEKAAKHAGKLTSFPKAKSSVRCSGHCIEMSWQSAAAPRDGTGQRRKARKAAVEEESSRRKRKGKERENLGTFDDEL